ncbi:MAG: hypothetical protein ACOCZA_08415 [Spirochaetota bacterium]
MPLIERKSIERLTPNEILYTNAGSLLKAGQPVSDHVIGELAKRRAPYVETGRSTKEEIVAAGGDLAAAAEGLRRLILQDQRREFNELREHLIENLKTIYLPYSEEDRSFQNRKRKKQISRGDLLEKNLNPLVRDDTEAGSAAVVDANVLRFTREFINSFYSFLSDRDPLTPETRKKRKVIQRLHLSSVRLHTHYDGERINSVGDALAAQATDTMLMFLHAMVNLNKKRIIEGKPLSESKYRPELDKGTGDVYRYDEDFIKEAALGIALMNVGLAHKEVHKLIPSPYLDASNRADLKKIRTLQHSVYAAHHLLDREDISSIARMMVTRQFDYPDATGYPPPFKNRFLHEFVRLFQIVRTYDEMTNPVLSRTAYNRMDVIRYLRSQSNEYAPAKTPPGTHARFDSNLVEEFLAILAPYRKGELVFLYPGERRSEHLYVGKVHSYLDSHIPLISILKDEKTGKRYRDGQLLLYIPKSMLLVMQNGKVSKRSTLGWIKELQIYDKHIDAGMLHEYEDFIFGRKRSFSKQLKGGRR